MDRQPSHSTPPTDTRHNLGPERLRVEELERRLEESLQECRAYQTAHEWWSALLENAPDHIAVISRAGMIQYVNRAIRDRSPESLQGTDAAGLMAPEPREPEGCACGEILTGAKTPPECPLYKTRCTPMNPVGP